MIVSKITPPPDAIVRPASQLAVGDRIAARFLPTRDPATIVFVLPYELAGREWVYLTHRDGERAPEPSWFKAEEPIWLESVVDTGLGYSREADDPTPVSPARVPLHTGGPVGTVRDSELVIDPTPGEPAGLRPEPIAAHYEARGWTGEGPGRYGLECACGATFGGFDYMGDAAEQLNRHIVDEAHAQALDEDGQRAAQAEPAVRRRGPHCTECMQDVPGGYQGLVQHQVEVHGAWTDVAIAPPS